MNSLERLATSLGVRDGEFTNGDVILVAEALCWDVGPWMSPQSFDDALAPFVDGLDVEQTGAFKGSVFRALPDLERAMYWEALELEVGVTRGGGDR